MHENKHLLSKHVIAELKISMSKMRKAELLRWKEHVLANPYNAFTAEKMVELLNEELGKR